MVIQEFVTFVAWTMLAQQFVTCVGWAMVAGTFLSGSKNQNQYIRIWDFPRLHVAGIMTMCIFIHTFLFQGLWHEYAYILSLASAIIFQATYIYPYLPLAATTVMRSFDFDSNDSLRLVISNVLQENQQYERLIKTLKAVDPDIIFAVEVNQDWLEHLKVFERTHPFVVFYPQGNYYGMAMFSRLKLVNTTVRFIVQDDVPSIHTEVELRNGTRVYFHGIHPRPPEPIRSQDSVPRDAELVLLGKEVAKEHARGPVIVAGDLNDVAWSHTSHLFQCVSRLLDPRKGRGMYSTYNAFYPFFRWPLDHVFTSNDFTLLDIRCLDQVGSDHLPIFIELKYEPSAKAQQSEPKKFPEQSKEVRQRIEAAEEQEGSLDGFS